MKNLYTINSKIEVFPENRLRIKNSKSKLSENYKIISLRKCFISRRTPDIIAFVQNKNSENNFSEPIIFYKNNFSNSFATPSSKLANSVI